MKEITYTRAAIRDLRRIPQAERDRLREKIRQYADDPQSLANNVTRLVGSPSIRLRVGAYRVIFKESAASIDILAVRKRTEATYRD